MDSEPSVVTRQWQRIGAELDRTVAGYFALERTALLMTAAVWTALAATTAADWDPIVKWLPFVLNVLFGLRAALLALRVAVLERTLAAAEQQVALPAELAPKGKRVGFFPAFVFWVVLLTASAVLPWFYIEQATDPGYAGDSAALVIPRSPSSVIPTSAATRNHDPSSVYSAA